MSKIMFYSILLLTVGAPFVGASQTAFGVDGSWIAQVEQRDEGSVAVTSKLFRLHSSPWINLHHFLYQWATSDGSELPEASALRALSAEEQHVWEQALEFYTQHIVEHDLLFSREMVRTKSALLQLDQGTGTEPDDLPMGLGNVLTAAMPVYEEHWWPEHDRLNQTWIDHVAPELERYEEEMAERLAEAYGGDWPSGRVRIDLSAYANWAGAYTTNRPDHVTISSRRSDGADLLALETVFHEVSHSASLQRPLEEAVEEAYAAAGVEAPTGLWHALIFYTAGELTRETLQAEGQEDYEAYAERNGFYERESWAGYRRAFDEHWKPHLRGEIDLSSALRRIAEDVSS